MAVVRRYRFTVRGSGEFPHDMLRYDACWPRCEIDSHKMNYAATCEGALREVELLTNHEGKLWRPTEGRWESHGWVVVVGSLMLT